MKNLNEFQHKAERLVKYQIELLNKEEISLYQVEKNILDFINKLGSFMELLILNKIKEPTIENRILINGKKSIYKGKSKLSFKDRFGQKQTISRRAYKSESRPGYDYPLDHKIGIANCKNHSPLLSYLICSYAANEPYGFGSMLLSESLGIKISSTAMQNNSERIGAHLPDNPLDFVPNEKQSEKSDLMIVEMDGTMSPQISAVEGLTGHESLKAPTEYKECNVLTVEKYTDGEKTDRWVGADYGKRVDFEEYLRKTTMKMGLLKAKKLVFVADGARHNWEMCKSYLPGAVEVLDFYHAIEHLSQFCDLFKDSEKGKRLFKIWRSMIREGDIFQVLDEMKKSLFITRNTDEAQKEINYLNKNKHRMAYDEYKEKKYPIGSGLIEGQCKLVVNKRFKRNGMRWKLHDNRSILKLRISFLNSILERYFQPKTIKLDFWQEESAGLSRQVAC
jgi:hypothetical protein